MKNTQTWQKYPLINKPLAKVNQCILDNIDTPYQDLKNALLEMASNGGKYLRPSLLILSAQIASGKKEVSDAIIKLASSIEILHMASLIHDDIVDDSDKRRARISIQAEFGKDVAVYAGDLLFTDFFKLMLDANSDQKYLVQNAHTMRQILNGELGQMAVRFDTKQSLDDYLNNIKGKTAALFRLAAQEGAYFAGGNEAVVNSLATFGECLGISFQIIDDILDYAGGKELNKPTLEDITTGVYSLPLLLALRHEDLRLELTPILAKKRQITQADIAKLQAIILNSSVIDESKDLAKKYTDQALASLAKVPQSPASTLLKKMTQKLINRTI